MMNFEEQMEIATDQEPATEPSASSRRMDLFLTIGIGGAIFLVYLATAAPGAWWGDGLELTCAAKTLGIPHPTGYPLYILIGHLLIQIFGARIEAGRIMTLFSSALCAGGTMILGWTFLRFNTAEPIRPIHSTGSALTGRRALQVCGMMLLLGFSRTLWEHATFAEVYPLTFFISSAIIMAVALPSAVSYAS
ncbi:DUF2723 domain-containing protein, partial [Candidatus Sumerlaeota bacterium]|nr:DUF2723 domain-containing protein [Candidatus Sumerlaeota bacterium]